MAKLSIKRPPLNILDIETLRELNRALAACQSEAVRVVVIGSAIEGNFSAGVDIGDHRADRLPIMLAEVREQARLLLTMPAVTIARLQGASLGGGAEIALLCDLIIGSEDCTIALPEIGLAAFPPIAAALLPERFPSGFSMSLLLGEGIDAPTAVKIGLLSASVPPAELDAAVTSRARQLASLSGAALAALIAASRGQRAGDLLARIDCAIEIYKTRIAPSHDATEGIDAFLAKRPAAWSHS
jgi:cyclohexa-1,5-dienecarbonyl-CoA hydratase